MWAPEGAVGIGGPAVVIYPTESPGSYQLFGRTLPLTRPASPGVSVEQAHLFRTGDRVRFVRVSEKELLELRLQVMTGAYDWQIEESEYRVEDYFESLETHAEQIAGIAAIRAAAIESVEIP
jgi:urea carboxylase